MIDMDVLNKCSVLCFDIYYCFHIFAFVNTCAVCYGTACRKCFKKYINGFSVEARKLL